MDSLATIGSWISDNESLLSGMAAMIVLGTVLLSPFGAGVLRVFRRDSNVLPERTAGTATSLHENSPVRLTLKDLTAPTPYEICFVQSDGVRIAFNERGNGSTTIVVSPGIISHLNIMENLPSWHDTMDSLSQFAHVVTFDKRGQGLSDPTLQAPSLEERTRDIEAVMDAAGIERAVLLGVSEGGPMSMHFAHSHPDRVQGLVLLGTTARFTQSEDFPIGIPRHSIDNIVKLWGTGVLRDLFFPSVSREQIDDNTYKAMENLIASRDAIRQVVKMMIDMDVRPLLSDITVPTLVVHFAGDLAVPIRLGRYIAEHIPGAEFMEVNAVDHGDLSQAPEAIERIKRFCEEIESGEGERNIT